MGSSTITHNGVEYRLTRLPSALEASRHGPVNRIRPWLSRSEQELLQAQRIERARRDNGIPAPDEWMW